MTITVDEDLVKPIEERAAKESRTTDEVANEMLRQSFEAAKPYKLELEGWNHPGELLVDVADRNKLYEVLYDEEEMKRRGF